MAVSVCTIMFIKRGSRSSRGWGRGSRSSSCSEMWAGAIVKDDLVTSALAQGTGQSAWHELKFQTSN